MRYLVYFIIILGSISFNNRLYSQTYTVESKSCGSCGGQVSNNSRIGMRCPHCGVRWGYENERTTYNSAYKYNKQRTYRYTKWKNISKRKYRRR